MRCVLTRAEGVRHRRSRITHAVRITFRKEHITQKSLFCLVDKRDFFIGAGYGSRTRWEIAYKWLDYAVF